MGRRAEDRTAKMSARLMQFALPRRPLKVITGSEEKDTEGVTETSVCVLVSGSSTQTEVCATVFVGPVASYSLRSAVSELASHQRVVALDTVPLRHFDFRVLCT